MKPEFPFKYAAHIEIIEKQLPTVREHTQEGNYRLYYKGIYIYEMPQNCGCLIISNLYYLTDKTYKEIENFASLNGYSIIICTISEEISNSHEVLEILKKNNFNILSTGFSNRSTRETEEDYFEYTCNTWLCYKNFTPIQKGYV